MVPVTTSQSASLGTPQISQMISTEQLPVAALAGHLFNHSGLHRRTQRVHLNAAGRFTALNTFKKVVV